MLRKANMEFTPMECSQLTALSSGCVGSSGTPESGSESRRDVWSLWREVWSEVLICTTGKRLIAHALPLGTTWHVAHRGSRRHGRSSERSRVPEFVGRATGPPAGHSAHPGRSLSPHITGRVDVEGTSGGVPVVLHGQRGFTARRHATRVGA